MKKLLKPLLISWLAFVLMPLHAQLFTEQSMKFAQALELIRSKYVDTVNDRQLTETAIIGMMKELDPHSSYMTAKEVKEMEEPLQGNFEGIGVQFNILNDTIFIIQTIPGGPSQKLGIQAGDKIIKIDGKNVAGIKITNNDVFSKLRGQKGTKVTISILRKGEKELIDFTITRDKIPIFSIDASYMLDNETGYIKLNRFSQTTGKEFEDAVIKLQSHNLKNMILDLTDNGGGYLEEAVRLADQFLDDDKLIVYTQGVHSRREEYKSTSNGLFEVGKLVILIDEGSASASEILSGAIQDWDRGFIVGRRSFGKGLVQRPLKFPDGSMLKLTVARYYTPSGRLIQKPYNKGMDEYEKDILNRYNKGEFSNKDSIHFPDSLKCYTLIDKRVVYGGGGIMPDFFVPIDTTGYTNYYRDIVRKGIVNKFVLNYIDQNRVSLKTGYPDIIAFDKNLDADTIVSQMLVYAEKQGLKPNAEQINISRPSLSKLVKAFIARDIWDSNEFYEIYNKDEPMIKEALDVINNWDSKREELLRNRK